MNNNSSLLFSKLRFYLSIRFFIFLALAFLTTSILSRCDYSRANFLYNDIAPSSPSDIRISNLTSSSVTILWTIADDQAYPTPTFSVYTILSGVTNVVSSTSSTNQAVITGLTSTTLYNTFVRSTNRAGYADSTNASFTTP